MRYAGRRIRRVTRPDPRLLLSRLYYPGMGGRESLFKKRPQRMRLDTPQKYNHSKSVIQPQLHGYTFWK
nr:MAG: hypothetical protein AM324_02450 [Candidatus Thorarchaeota archaeon SMTZ1-83]